MDERSPVFMMNENTSMYANDSRNVIKAANGLEIFTSRIYELVDEYINNLPNPDLIYGTNKLCFTGMIKHVYIYYFKDIKLPYEDIEFLNNIWLIYTNLCYTYNKKPNILNFCLFTGVDNSTIIAWANNTTRMYVYKDLQGNIINNLPGWQLGHRGEQYIRELSTKHSAIVQRWRAECESALVDAVSEEGKNIGAIFLLKAQYGYRETAPTPAPAPTMEPLSLDQLPQLDGQNMQIDDKNTISCVHEIDGHNM